MSAELWILVATAVLAVVAIGAALIAVRAARRGSRFAPVPPERLAVPQTRELARLDPLPDIEPVSHDVDPIHSELEPRVVEGHLIVPPSQQQVVNTALGRPGVRLSILAHGLAHALRPESRDRITSLMRREYRRRRRERLQAGRRAVRAGRPTPPSEEWLGGS
ncbi:hypothetical protein ASE12_03610 [Aeromicrobium sp. Root236]|uniref:hypothetical protein n=1 Tax=Aeromicrobium sp. Root236 TaxID=1736498 RepID=UPI0006F1DD9E|nr:hypothetical protein [Aeromicrobium sp. Root236]KRC63930.1 hypothetical protein ASE12_03610 [Aeromicrobium sp. Root236]